jgi:hypothetical protein
MSSLLQPLHLLLMMFSGWVNRHQLDLIDYIQEENRLLKERLGGQRLRFTDAERRRLARRAFALGRKALNELQTLVTPDTVTLVSHSDRAQVGLQSSTWSGTAANAAHDCRAESNGFLRGAVASACDRGVRGALQLAFILPHLAMSLIN